jgi:predicted HTH domain antitoxin
METVSVELPAALLQAADLDASNLSQEAARLVALELFREEKISLSRAAELSGTPLAGLHGFRLDSQCLADQYGMAELEEDRRILAELGL